MSDARVPYDEFGLFHENAAEYGLDLPAPPAVRRVDVAVDGDRAVSALVWGDAPAELVLIHGGSQNAHTWDTVALALDRPLVAVDLPGHGHSGWRDDGRYDPATLAADVALAIDELAPDARMVVGMSLGGMTSIALADQRADLVRSLVLVDVTPGVNREKAKAVIDFVSGPQSFASFQELLDRTIEHHPTRSESSLRRGILHNAHQLADGSWEWRYDRRGKASSASHDSTGELIDAIAPLWDAVGRIACPVMLVQGADSPVVDDDDVAEMYRRQPDLAFERVEGAGHSIQGDKPLELAAIIATRLAG